MDLHGKVAVITGAASSIGAATARLFAQSGAQIVIAGVQDQRGQRLAEELGPAARSMHCDVSSEAQVRP
ncbi:MAG TPA: SDR family oxidoreductase [Roseiflexaceae bacterium]|nr:SDR family oxidoreductase [Roseiflexaceae bacterium]